MYLHKLAEQSEAMFLEGKKKKNTKVNRMPVVLSPWINWVFHFSNKSLT